MKALKVNFTNSCISDNWATTPMATTVTCQRWRLTNWPTWSWSLMTTGVSTRVTWLTTVLAIRVKKTQREEEAVLMVIFDLLPELIFWLFESKCWHFLTCLTWFQIVEYKLRHWYDCFSGVCHARERIGYKISSYSTSSSLRVGSVQDCSGECQRDSSCNSFSFR